MPFMVKVDWNADGTYTGAYDDISADIQSISTFAGMRQPFQDIADESTLTLVVIDSLVWKYIPENPSSPLYGLILPNRKIQLEFSDGTATTILWSGRLESIHLPQWLPGPDAWRGVAQLVCTSRKQLLQDTQLTHPLWEDTTADIIIEDILGTIDTGVWRLGVTGSSEVGLTTVIGGYDFETGVKDFEIYGDTPTQNAYQMIAEVVAAERGRFYFDRDDNPVLWNRNHLLADLVDDATIDTGSGLYQPTMVSYEYGSLITTSVKVTANPRQTRSDDTLWELDKELTIPAGQERTFEAKLREPISGRPVGVSGIAASNTSWGTGTASITTEQRGDVVRINAANSGAIDAILDGLDLAGQAIVAQHQIVAIAEDSTALAIYGRRQEVNLNLVAVTSYDEAQDIAEFELLRRQDVLGCVRSLQYNRLADGIDNAHLLAWQIGTRIALNANEYFHAGDYFIVGEEHQLQASDKWRHRVVYYLEPARETAIWLLGVTGSSEIGSTTVIGL